MATTIKAYRERASGSVSQSDVSFALNPVNLPGVVAAATVAATEYNQLVVRQTKLALTSVLVTVGNTTGVSFGGTKVFTFPLGRIALLATIDNVSFGLTNAGNVTPIAAGHGGDFSCGTTVAGDGTLTGQDVDIIPSTSIDPISAGSTGAALAAWAYLDGTSTAVPVYFNILIDDSDVADGASDVLEVTATLTLTWINLGDY